jgi:hypothetical protein
MSIVANTESFVEEHPYATAGIAIGVVILLWYLLSGSSTPASTTVVQPDTTADAAQVAENQAAQDAATAQTQIAANATVQQATIAAGVANSSTAAQEAASIAQSNSQTAIAQSTNDDALTAQGNATIGSEFANLASLLTTFSNNTTSVQNTGIATTGNVLTTLANDQTALSTTEQNDFYQTIQTGNEAYLGNSNLAASLGLNPGSTSNSNTVAAQIGALVNGSQSSGNGQATVATATSGGDGPATTVLASQLISQLGAGVQFHANN